MLDCGQDHSPKGCEVFLKAKEIKEYSFNKQKNTGICRGN